MTSGSSVFDSTESLRALGAPPGDPASEPPCNFPLAWYEAFLDEVRRLDVCVVTYADLFQGSDDWDYRSDYAGEFRNWRRARDPRRRYLLIQHDVDNRPAFTRRIVAMEALHSVRSNIFLFGERHSRRGPGAEYVVDHAFFQEAERRGFVIGYHQNALSLAGSEPGKADERDVMAAASERYRSDVAILSRLYRIGFVVPHGGRGCPVGGKVRHNTDVDMPPEFERCLRWVYNGHAARFAARWSDGGLRKLHRRADLDGLDLVGFVRRIRPGTRAFCLVHPQRWGHNVDSSANPLLAERPWYRDVVNRYAAHAGAGGGRQEEARC